jgi:cell division septum initiation protein DivIVA
MAPSSIRASSLLASSPKKRTSPSADLARIRSMTEQLQSFQERERAMNEALVAAQQLRTDSRSAAEREAESLLAQARGEASLILQQAEGEERLVRERTAQAQVHFAAYVAGLRAMLERQLAELAGLEAQVER